MRFLFRAAFWLLVMSAIIPGSGGNSLGHAAVDAVKSQASSIGSGLGTLCSASPGECLTLAQSGLAALTPAASSTIAPNALPSLAAVPLPAARPRTLDPRG